MEKILAISKPGAAKAIGRVVKNFDAAVWECEAFSIVVEGNYQKFSQQPQLRRFLLETGDLILVEASPVDFIWGIGLALDSADIYNPLKWRGKNLLGFALMAVRDLLKSEYE